MLGALGVLALIAGLILLWWIGIRLFLWVLFAITSLFPWVGHRHRHAQWDELNRIDR